MKALLAALLLVGCAHVHNDYRLPPQTKTVRFERALPRDLVALDKAIAWWGKRGQTLVEVTTDEVDINILSSSDPETGLKIWMFPDEVLGVTYTVNGHSVILLNGKALDEPDSCPRATVIAHELGHALGQGHTDDPEDLMYYSCGGKSHLD